MAAKDAEFLTEASDRDVERTILIVATEFQRVARRQDSIHPNRRMLQDQIAPPLKIGAILGRLQVDASKDVFRRHGGLPVGRPACENGLSLPGRRSSLLRENYRRARGDGLAGSDIYAQDRVGRDFCIKATRHRPA